MELALGTVQFGIGYGIAGRSDPVSEADTRQILAFAHERGIRRLDTAPAYGDIEQRLLACVEGRDFEIVSKVAAIPAGLDTDAACAFVRASIAQSLSRLGERLRGVIFHNEADVAGERAAAIWRVAAAVARDAGIAIGVSRYGLDDLAFDADAPRVEMMQVAGNAFDQRIAAWQAPAPQPEVSLRSAFLQGVLLMNAEAAERKLPAAVPAVRRWIDWCRAHDLPQLRAALSIVKGFDPVRYCLIGVDTLDQLKEIGSQWDEAVPMSAPEVACADPAVIDPRQWGR